MWHKVAKLSDVSEGQSIQVRVEDRLIAIFSHQGQFFALRDECTHAGAALSEGRVRNFRVSCPLHAAQFDIRTGEGVGELAYNNVRAFKTRISGDDIEIDI